jgi:glutaredoxin-related protein
MSNYYYYLIHVGPDCPWCARAKALIEHYGADYRITTDRCEEWPSVPAIYKIGPVSRELIGGYDQLCALSFENGL